MRNTTRKARRRRATSVLVTATLAIVFLLLVLNSNTYEQVPADLKPADDELKHANGDDVEQPGDDDLEHPESPGGLSFSKSSATHLILFPLMLLFASMVTRLFVMTLHRNPSGFIRML